MTPLKSLAIRFHVVRHRQRHFICMLQIVDYTFSCRTTSSATFICMLPIVDYTLSCRTTSSTTFICRLQIVGYLRSCRTTSSTTFSCMLRIHDYPFSCRTTSSTTFSMPSTSLTICFHVARHRQRHCELTILTTCGDFERYFNDMLNDIACQPIVDYAYLCRTTSSTTF